MGDFMKFGIIIAAALLAAPAFAGDDIDCNRDDLPQQAMNICAGQAYDKSDKKLNGAYTQLMAAQDDAGFKEKLKAAQRNWIQFRDTECTFETADNEGGSIHPFVYAGCLKRMTEARTKELKALLACQKDAEKCGM